MFLKSKRFLSLFLCAVLTLAAFSPVFGEISSESTGTKFYSDIDTEKVIAFLQQPAGDTGYCNGEMLCLAYGYGPVTYNGEFNDSFFQVEYADPQDPNATDRLLYTNFAIRRVPFDRASGEKSYFEDVIVDFYGTFDLSGSTLVSLGTPFSTTHITEIELSSCERLRILSFSNQPYCTQARALNCPNLRGVNLSGVYTDIEVQPRLFSRPVRLNTLGSGTVSFVYGESGTEIGGENETGSVGAQGENFLGWYSEGSIHSAEADFEITDGISATACFAGDINADGNITMQDAIAALRAAVGVTDMNSIDFAMADVDCSGNIGIPDALAIARLCMGVL